jgi:hypothetical protein
MRKTFLRTRIQKQIPSPLTTSQAADVLQKLGATVDRQDSDWMPFELNGEDYRVEGIVERWAGTESRIRYEGEITLATPNDTLRNRLTVAAVVLIVLGSVAYITPLSMRIFGTDGAFIYINIHIFFALVAAVIISIPIVYLIMRDPQAQRRWDAQQRLGQLFENLEQIVTKD